MTNGNEKKPPQSLTTEHLWLWLNERVCFFFFVAYRILTFVMKFRFKCIAQQKVGFKIMTIIFEIWKFMSKSNRFNICDMIGSRFNYLENCLYYNLVCEIYGDCDCVTFFVFK